MTELAWVAGTAMVCASCLVSWRWWLNVQPPCTAEEFRKVVDQCNRLTEAMVEVKASADSVRSAVGMSRLNVTR